VADDTGPVEITGLELAPGTTTLTLHSDAPGMLESKAPGARALTFALFNPQVKQ
jgi:hypothetical protein